jgi:O-methyltransferase / aklanonic acid methyltransferase
MDEEVVGLWRRAASTYETEIPYFELMGERIVDHAELRPGEAVLDVACGKGATLVPAARAVGDTGQVLGVDIVEDMVEATHRAIADAGLSNAEARVMDGEALDLPNASFDVVVMAFGLGFLRPERALPEVARVLRRPGRFVTSVPAGGGSDWAFFGELCEEYGLVPKGQPGGSRIPSPQEVAEMFGTAGLALQPPVFDAVTVTFPDEEAWWRWVWSHGQRGFLEQLADDQVDEFKAAAFVALQAFAKAEGLPLEQQFLVLKATF